MLPSIHKRRCAWTAHAMSDAAYVEKLNQRGMEDARLHGLSCTASKSVQANKAGGSTVRQSRSSGRR